MKYSAFKEKRRLEEDSGTSPNKFISLLFGGTKRRREQNNTKERKRRR